LTILDKLVVVVDDAAWSVVGVEVPSRVVMAMRTAEGVCVEAAAGSVATGGGYESRHCG
jgi:hypothetical protein